MGFCRRIPIRLSQFLTQTPFCPLFCSVEFAGHCMPILVPAGVFYVCSEFFEFGGVVIVAVYFTFVSSDECAAQIGVLTNRPISYFS